MKNPQPLAIYLLVPLLVAGSLPAAAQEPTPTSVTESVPSQERKPLSLKEAVELTTSSHPMVRAAAATLEGYKNRASASDWLWLPKLSLKGFGSATPEKFGTPDQGGTNYDVWGPILTMEFSAILPVYTFGKLQAIKEMAHAGVEVGEAQKSIVRGQLELVVARAYLGIQLAATLDQIITEGEQYIVRAREYLEELRDQDSREYDDVDMLRLKVVEADIAGRRLELDRGKEMGIESLIQLTGQNRDRVSDLPKLKRFSIPEKEIHHYLHLAALNRPEMKVLAAAVKVQSGRVELEKARFYPDIFVGFFYTIAKSWVIDDQGSPFAYDPYNTWGAGGGIGFEWRFDYAERVGSLDEQRANLRSLQFQGTALLQKVELEVRDAYTSMNQQREAIRLHEIAFKAAKGWTIAKLDLYENGFAELRDFTDALKEFFTRKLSLEMAVMEYNLAAVRLAVSCGVSLDVVTEVE